MKLQFYGDLYNQVRDDENAITMKIKCAASEFSKVINIPTRQLLKITVETVDSEPQEE